MLIKVGTGASKLALVQTDILCERLRPTNPNLTIEKKIIASKKIQNFENSLRYLQKGRVLDREIFKAVFEGRIDFAVQGMKDIPILENDSRLVIACTTERGSPADVVVSRGHATLRDLETGSVIGVGSPIRASQLSRVRPDLKVEPIHGRVEERIRMVDRGKVDAVILAEAGLARLGLTERIAERLPIDEFIPVPGQGIIAAVARSDNQPALDILKLIEHFTTRIEAETERSVLKALARVCKVPVGALASASGDRVSLTARILSVDGKQKLQATASGPLIASEEIGRKVAEELLAQGAKALEDGWRKTWR